MENGFGITFKDFPVTTACNVVPPHPLQGGGKMSELLRVCVSLHVFVIILPGKWFAKVGKGW